MKQFLTKYKYVFVAIALVAVIATVIICYTKKSSLKETIIGNADFGGEAALVSVEKMIIGDMQTINVDPSSDNYQRLVDAINNTKIRFIKSTSEGIKIEDAVYTLQVRMGASSGNYDQSEDFEAISVSVNSLGELLINETEKMYQIDDGTELFDAMADFFE